MHMTQAKNHPQIGAAIKVYPIRSLRVIRHIKKRLKPTPRDYCLFTFGINTAYRANELLSLRVGQVKYLKAGDTLDIKQSKTATYRATTLNIAVIDAIGYWLAAHPDSAHDDAPLFKSKKGNALGVSPFNHLVKRWCDEAGLKENYGTHTLRKTWGYQQRKLKNTPIPLLMDAYGHSSQKETLEYLCIQNEEIQALYTTMVL